MVTIGILKKSDNMVGLTGIVATQKNSIDIEKLLSNMCVSIKHSDKHKVEQYFDKEIGICRVHIGVLNPESQPIFNKDKTVFIMMDGEIYDYQDSKEQLISKGYKFLVNNDPEFILYLYEEYGNDFVHKLNGCFSIVIWDKKSHKLLIANDRHGLRPIYYADNNGYILFGSETKAIIQDRDFKKIVDDRAVAELFSLGFIMGNKTLFRGIELLPPASMLTYKDGKILVEQYWDYDLNKKYDNYSEEYYIEKLSKFVLQAVERRMKKNNKKEENNRIGVLLSGGLDSRTIVGSIDKKYYPIHTFTYGKLYCGDAKFAHMISDKLGTIHHYYELKPEYFIDRVENVVYLTEGMLNIFNANFLLSDTLEKMSEFTDIVLHGYLGDTTTGNRFAGRSFVLINHKDNFKILTDVSSYLPVEFLRNLFDKNYFRQIEKDLNFSKDYVIQMGNNIITSKDRLMYYLLRERNRRIIAVGFSFMRNILEDRTPFTDNDYIDFILKVPNAYKIEQRIYKKMILSTFPDLRDVPCQSTGIPLYKTNFQIRCKQLVNLLTQKIFKTKLFSDEDKEVVDYSKWTRDNKELREYIYSVLLDKRTLERSYFNQEFIKEILDLHFRGEKDYLGLIGLLLTFELWNRQFIDKY